MEGADIYQIAKNCRTSVEMIEKYYASHIKTNLDAVAINVMRPKKKAKAAGHGAGGRAPQRITGQIPCYKWTSVRAWRNGIRSGLNTP